MIEISIDLSQTNAQFWGLLLLSHVVVFSLGVLLAHLENMVAFSMARRKNG